MRQLKEVILDLSIDQQIELAEWINVNARPIALTLRHLYSTENQRANCKRAEAFVACLNRERTSRYCLVLTPNPLTMNVITHDGRGSRVIRFMIDLDTREVRSGASGDVLCYLPEVRFNDEGV